MRLILLLLTSLSIQQTIFAQSFEGFIYDSDNNPLEWTNIINYSQSSHTHSGPDGFFAFNNCALGDSIVVSFIGYQSKSFIIDDFSKQVEIHLEKKSITIDEITIAPQVDALNLFTDINIQLNPVESSQEVLTQVPGLFIGQHAGGGKAEQIFLRGFDIDHGTDINLTVDGMPVNMVSHAHGQGYSDLHFVIPETIENIDFGKGSYEADKGNFTTAGYVAFNTKDRLRHNIVKVEADQYNMQRLMSMISILDNQKRSAFIAAEHISNDGFFESPQNFKRTNIFGKYKEHLTKDHSISLTLSHFDSQWDASGQIPVRSVEDGTITRFGAIDDTEGGFTSRTNVLLENVKVLGQSSVLRSSMYYTHYDFELFSNFTFFLNDPINGDQIRQVEDRHLYGINTEYSTLLSLGKFSPTIKTGVDFRTDNSNGNELANTVNRVTTLNKIQSGNIDENNIGTYVSSEIDINKWTFVGSLRYDYFNFEYHDLLSSAYDHQSASTGILSPKFNIIYNMNHNFQYYFKIGKGFHSNDTRVSVSQNANEVLPSSLSTDIGLVWKPTSNLLINAAVWNLALEQEFVYVGDEGIVEPSGRTNRNGIDLSIRYQPISSLFVNFDANYTSGKFIDELEGENHIPLAPNFTIVSGITYVAETGLFGGINLKHLGDRPANEDNSIIAEGYSVVDMNIGYSWDNLTIGLHAANLFDVSWNETQFATTSRLQNETVPVEEIHFTPGTPFNLKGSISYKF